MIRLFLDPPRFECETASDAAELARLMGIAPRKSSSANRSLRSSSCRYARPAGHPRGRMTPQGTEKTCRKCGDDFPIVDRSDCAAVFCKPCRPKPGRKPDAPKTPVKTSKGKPVTPKPMAAPARAETAPTPVLVHRVVAAPQRPQVLPAAVLQMVTCRGVGCGASVPPFETIDGLCLECAPMRRRA